MTEGEEAAPPQARPPEMVAATDRSIELTGLPQSVSLRVPEATRSRVAAERAGRVSETGEGRIYLNVEDIDAARNPGIVYGVFVNVPPNASEGERARHHAGNVTLFGIEAMNNPDRPHESVPGFRHTFDITDLVSSLTAANQWNPDAITVTFAPILPISDGRESGAAELAHASITPVTIGRVSLFFP